jgi:hypothetical protein
MRNIPTREGGKPVVKLACPCVHKRNLWGEFWWAAGGYQWVFFDDLQTSETYAEQVSHCPSCGRRLERKDLELTL